MTNFTQTQPQVTSRPLRVSAYTGGLAVPSARFRIRQYIAEMRAFGIDLDEFPSRAGNYPPPAIWRRPGWLLAALAERSFQAVSSRKYDAVIFQRELISTLMTLEPLFGGPRILDVDDAIWLHPRGAFASRLAAKCEAIICGNVYLADYFSRHNRKVFVLPTGVDGRRFKPAGDLILKAQTIGWSGTSANLDQLQCLEPAIAVLFKRFPSARLRVICDQPPRFSNIPSDRVDYVRWSPDTEVSGLQDLRVGLMPLADTAWTRGKCAFKMLTYMACGIPVVVSPVGMNADVLAMGDIGIGARTMDEWIDAVGAFLLDSSLAKRIGKNGRLVIEESFSIEALSPKLSQIIRTVTG